MWYGKRSLSFNGDGIRPAIIVFALLVMGMGEGPGHTDSPLEWTIGSWRGVRREASTGDEAPMSLIVERAPDGRSLIERLEVETEGDPYVGFSVSVPDPTGKRWTRIYANDVRSKFARLVAASVQGDRVVWLSVTATPPRGSRLVSERLGPNRWRRTQQVSTDDGATWHDLFVDDLTLEGVEQ